MATSQSDDKRPAPDHAEDNAFFPSPYSLSQFTSPKSDLSGADYPNAYKGGRWKILLIGADERYLLTDNGTMFPRATILLKRCCLCITSIKQALLSMSRRCLATR